MTVIRIVSRLILVLMTTAGYAQDLTPEETALYELIMQYRKERGLSTVPISKSLTRVAQTHAKDLSENYTWNETCNLHSWSDKGVWKPVCYTGNHKQAKLMWSKPSELTSYKGNGYEIAFATGGDVKAAEALATWKSSPGHNAVIVNEGGWKTDWKAIGIGVYGGYAVVWFGHEQDQ